MGEEAASARHAVFHHPDRTEVRYRDATPDLGASSVSRALPWIVVALAAVTIVVTVFLIVGGSLGDRSTRTRDLSVGLVAPSV